MAPIQPRERAPRPVALAKEFVLRGGFLRKAGSFSTEQHVSGATYVPLWKTDPLLNAFLTPVSSALRPLTRTSVFEDMADARNQAVRKAEDDAKAPGSEGEEDRADDLGLDAGAASELEESQSSGGRARRRPVKRELALPPTVTIELRAAESDDPWRFRVLANSAREAPAMEATQDNFQRLFDFVQADLSEGGRKRGKNGGTRPPSERLPAGARNVSRDYKKESWVARRVVDKPAAAATNRTTRPYARAYLTRRFRSQGGLVDDALQQAGWFANAAAEEASAFVHAEKAEKKRQSQENTLKRKAAEQRARVAAERERKRARPVGVGRTYLRGSALVGAPAASP